MEIASYGAWFVAEEGGIPTIKRQCFDEFGEHAGYQLLEGDARKLVWYAQLGQRAADFVNGGQPC
jgi:hypothetical protein